MNARADHMNDGKKEDGMNPAESAKSHDRSGDLPIYESERLFAGTREIGIEHAGSVYRLRITRQGKLILNK